MRIDTRRDAQLREHPLDPSALARAVEQGQRDLPIARRNALHTDNPTPHLILARELGRLGRYLHLQGDSPAAAPLLTEAIDLFQRHGKDAAALMARLHYADALPHLGQPTEARALCDALLAEIARDARPVYAPFILTTRAAARLALGDRDGARADLRDAAHDLYTEGQDARGDALAALREQVLGEG